VIFPVIAVCSKSKAVEGSSKYHHLNSELSLVGSVGFVACSPRFIVCEGISLHPFELNVTLTTHLA
jgi:hypothetical protein